MLEQWIYSAQLRFAFRQIQISMFKFDWNLTTLNAFFENQSRLSFVPPEGSLAPEKKIKKFGNLSRPH